MSYGKEAFVRCNLPVISEVIDQIHLAGGIAVLSHPGNSIKEDISLLNEIVHLGLDGIEAYSSYHSEFQNVFYVEYALKRNLLVTCGSDFYGQSKQYIRIGNTHCPMSEEEILEGFRRKGLVI
jgi:predicted metal-dependent phosphoesterase TrpH